MPPRKGYMKDPAIRQAIHAENATGLRYCSWCDKFLPVNQFKKTGPRMYVCIPHIREKGLLYTLGTPSNRAFNAIRCKARQDMLEFGFKSMCITKHEVIAKLSEEQMAHYSDYCLIPKRPDIPLSEANSIMVTATQRIYIFRNWRKTRDTDQYIRDLEHILKPHTGEKNKNENV